MKTRTYYVILRLFWSIHPQQQVLEISSTTNMADTINLKKLEQNVLEVTYYDIKTTLLVVREMR